MHYGEWHDDRALGMMWVRGAMMLVLFAVIVWLIVMVVRHSAQIHSHQPAALGPAVASRPTPQEILAERLARGEIEPDDYARRVSALTNPPNQ